MNKFLFRALVVVIALIPIKSYADAGGWSAGFGEVRDSSGNPSGVFVQSEDWAELAQSFYEAIQGVEMEVDAVMDDVPQVESCCVSSSECGKQLETINDFVREVFNQLEKNYREYYAASEKGHLLHSAASYDDTQAGMMQKLHGALNQIDELEQRHCGQTDWFKMHGSKLLVALRGRYLRTGAVANSSAKGF